MLPDTITHKTHAGPNLYGVTAISSPDGSLPDIQPTELYDPSKRGDGSRHDPGHRTGRTGRSHDGRARTRAGPVPVLQGGGQDPGRTGESQANQGGGPAEVRADPGLGYGRLAGGVGSRHLLDGGRGDIVPGGRPGERWQRDCRAGPADIRPGESAGGPSRVDRGCPGQGSGQGTRQGASREGRPAGEDPQRVPAGLGQVRGGQERGRPQLDHQKEAGRPARPPGLLQEGTHRGNRRVPPRTVRVLRQGRPGYHQDHPEEVPGPGRGPAGNSFNRGGGGPHPWWSAVPRRCCRAPAAGKSS